MCWRRAVFGVVGVLYTPFLTLNLAPLLLRELFALLRVSLKPRLPVLLGL